MALGGQQRTPIPVGKRPSVGGSLQAFRLKRPDFAILPPLLIPPSEADNNTIPLSTHSVTRQRRSSADDADVKMRDGAVVMDRTDAFNLLSDTNAKRTTMVDRVKQLERTIVFLQDKHRELLAALHAEIRSLKDQNRDLVYKLTLKQEGWMDWRPNTSGSLSEPRPGSASRSSIARIKLLEAQLSEAQTKLGEVVSRNQYLTNTLLDMMRFVKEDDVPATALGKRSSSQDSCSSALGFGSSVQSIVKTPVSTSSSGSISLEEAEARIRALEFKNEDYRVEIIRLRTELMNALSENELAKEDQEIVRWSRVDARPFAAGTNRTLPQSQTSREYHLPKISGARVDSRSSTARNSQVGKPN